MRPDEKQLFQATLGELSALQAGKVSPATYMFDVMRKAAELGGNDPEKFVRLISMPFSGPSYKDTERAILGTSYNPAGWVLERAYEHLVRGAASSIYSGFNPNISDVNSNSTVTHHFREFLLLGFKKGQGVANLANENGDDTVEGNPGDLRSGYFGSMIGAGLRNRELTPQEAINITEWAYKLHTGELPLWGNLAPRFGTRGSGSETLGDYYLDTRQYSIHDWKNAFDNRNR